MLTRLYIDNFRCFVNFEYRPGRKQLLLGANGTGKSSLIDALLFIRGHVVAGMLFDDAPIRQLTTRWITRLDQRFEIEASIADQTYLYVLRTDIADDGSKWSVVQEALYLNQRPLLEFVSGQVTLHGSGTIETVTYPLEPNRSSLASIPDQVPYKGIATFRNWLNSVRLFRINPFSMLASSEKESLGLKPDLSNFASWYRSSLLSSPKQQAQFLVSLQAAIEGFDVFRMPSQREDNRTLIAEFAASDQASVGFSLTELSEGQKCLVGLYAILHFFMGRGETVFIDEPDNFISLREIQPWLTALSDALDDGKGQAILISHHPELINQWAPDYGVEFFRDGNGPVRVRRFEGDSESPLSPAELIARGWDNA